MSHSDFFLAIEGLYFNITKPLKYTRIKKSTPVRDTRFFSFNKITKGKITCDG